MQQWDWIGPETTNGRRVVKKDGLYGMIDSDGDIRIPCQWDAVDPEGFGVQKDGKWGIFDIYAGFGTKEGKLLEPCRWDTMEYLKGHYKVSSEGKFGIVYKYYGAFSYACRILISCQWEDITWEQNRDQGFRVLREGKWGMIDGEGTLILPPVWEDVRYIENQMIPVKKQGKWGYVNLKGKPITPCQWEDATSQGQVLENGKWGLVTHWRGLIHQCRWDEIVPLFNGAKVRLGDKWGMLRSNDTLRVPCQWEDIWPSGFHCSVRQNGKWGMLDNQNRLVIPCRWDSLSIWSDFVSVIREGKHGWLDLEGNTLIECRWDNIQNLDDGLYLVKEGDRCGVLGEAGRLITPPQWEHISLETRDGQKVLQVKKDGCYGYLDMEGREIVPCRWERIERFRDGMAQVSRGGKVGMIDEQYREIIECKWDRIEEKWGTLRLWDNSRGGYREFRNGCLDQRFDLIIERNFRTIVEKDGKRGMVNQNKEIIIPIIWEDVDQEHAGFYPVKQRGKWGFTDQEGRREVIPCRYDQVTSFFSSITPVRVGEKWGFVAKDGTEVVAPKYDRFQGCYNGGLYRMVLNGNWGIVNQEGVEIVPCLWDNCQCAKDKIMVKHGDKWGLFSQDGRELSPCLWDEIRENGQWMRRGDKWGLFSEDGRPLTPICFEEVGRFLHISGAWGTILKDQPPVARVKQDGRYGFLRPDGSWVSPCIWTEAQEFGYSYTVVSLGGFRARLLLDGQVKWTQRLEQGLCGELRAVPVEGKIQLIGPGPADHGTYDQVTPWCNAYGYILVEQKGKFGVLDRRGNKILAPEYEAITFGTEDLLVRQNGKWQFFLPEKKGFLEAEFEEGSHFLGTHARVKKDGIWGLMDQHGYFRERNWTDYGSEIVDSMNEGMVLVEMNGRYGLKDRHGRLVTPCIWEDVGICQENAIAVKLHGCWGFVDRQGRQTVACRWDRVTHFSRGMAQVCRGERWYSINKADQVFLHCNFHEGLARARQNSLWGYVDNRGNVAIDFAWDRAEDFENGFAIVRRNGLRYTIDRNGNT